MSAEALYAHLASGTTTVARAWRVARADGVVMGFTDHDRDLVIGGEVYRAGTGLTAKALQQTTGLAVDNTEAMGALSDAAITEGDILAGRFDGAEVTAWLVNWAATDDRVMQFRGSLGEIQRAGGAFQAELRGLTEALNLPQGRVIQRPCAAILGDGACRFDLSLPGYFSERAVEVVEDGRVFRWADFTGFDDRWFERGRFRVLTGAAAGVVGVVKNDRLSATGREVELWQAVLPGVAVGDMVRIEAGCDKRAETCRLKFGNFPNHQGFPHVPGEDWLASYPVRTALNDGGSLGR
ncbi:MAG: DUF2163 domain-containing protein [Gemmobacter sp.]